jgi:hypothetical protein
MKNKMFFFAILFHFCSLLTAQNGTKYFILEKRVFSSDGSNYSILKEIGFPSKYSLPQDSTGKVVDFISCDVDSIKDLISITSSIFTPDEILKLRKQNCHADCLVSSSGRIIYISFLFLNREPEIDRVKLFSVAKLIKEHILIKLSVPSNPKIVKDGYYPFSFPIYLTKSPRLSDNDEALLLLFFARKNIDLTIECE